MLQWADTFNRYGTTKALLLNGLYANLGNSFSLVADIDPTSTQKVAKMLPDAFSPEQFRFAFPGGAKATMGIAARIWLASLPAQPVSITTSGWQFRDISNAIQVLIGVETNGAISVYRGNAAALLYTTTVPVIAANAYNHVEMKVKVDSAAGSVEVRVNGVTVVNLTNVNTQATGNASSAQIAYYAYPGYASAIYAKDFIVWDTTGTYNNNFLGSVSVIDIDTNADTSLTWTPSTGTTGYQILDNNPPLDDAAYISAATALSNTFGLADLPADTTSVRGLVLVNRSKKIDGGDGNVQMGMISGASTGLGTDRPITTAYTYWADIFEVDPATGVPFTPSGFNAASFKLARTL